ncbi:hypothetical protein BDV59DRAFT_197093 [Aspergillus ambiguus]|uniref:uncharacterized protein n=1 Tax=Aspergillus ambiguus TaxID=176160 RepID=UPI003CCCC42D
MRPFYPNCTLPSPVPTFVAAPNVRGTLDIVWSCLSIIILCAWSILHLNVPPQVTPRTKRQYVRRQIFFALRKLKWAIITLLAPELIIGYAGADLWSVRDCLPELARLADEDGISWTAVHTLYANMGGFIVRFPTSMEEPKPEDQRESAQPTTSGPSDSETEDPRPRDTADSIHEDAGNRWTSDDGTDASLLSNSAATAAAIEPTDTLTQVQPSRQGRGNEWARVANDCHLWVNRQQQLCSLGQLAWEPDPLHCALATKLIYEDEYGDEPTYITGHALCLQGSIWVLDAHQLLTARRYGIIRSLPAVSEDDLSDRDKANGLVKVLAILQVSWLIAQLIARKAADQPSTPLEIMTLSYAVCAFITYLLYWSCPQDIHTSVYINASRHPNGEEFEAIANAGPNHFWFTRKYYNMSNNAIHGYRGSIVFWYGTGVGAIVFGCVHLFAWSFTFPTDAERLLWRICTVLVISLPPVTMLATVVAAVVFPRKRLIDSLISVYVWVSTLCFALCRLFLLVEALRSLYYLPSEAFVATWTANAPSFS